MLTYEEVKNNEAIRTYIQRADESLVALGFTEHSFAHVTHVAETAGYILETLGYPARTVELVKMGTQATVLSVNKDGSLQLQAGILKITARQEEVRVVEGETQQSAKKVVARAEHKLRTLGASPEVDLRGMMTDEAIGALDLFLDNAVLGKLNEVRIIHGKGTGAVRKAVREHLKRSRYVKSFRPGRYGEGEDGVTIAELR